MSRNDVDVRCQISGSIRGLDGSPCANEREGGYVMCPIWRGEKERIWENKRPNKASEMIRSDALVA